MTQKPLIFEDDDMLHLISLFRFANWCVHNTQLTKLLNNCFHLLQHVKIEVYLGVAYTTCTIPKLYLPFQLYISLRQYGKSLLS